MQSLVNLIYGVAVGIGLYFLGVPYSLVWAALAATLRFIPYIGPVLGAGAPILVSLAALQGWAGPMSVVGLFVVLELFTNFVLETVLYAGAAGSLNWRYSRPWRSGRGSGDHSACSWRHR
jgi:predicted PurR-regulated permease PerM